MRKQHIVPAILVRLIAVLVAFPPPGWGEQVFPEPDWQDSPDPIASPDAVDGGSISSFAGQYPDSLNYYLANNTFSREVFVSMYEALLGMDPITAEYVPNLAKAWTISEDKTTFTFELDPRARWSDGHPVTAEDVRWTFDAIMDPANLTGAHKVALETFEPPAVLDQYTIRFRAREVHWRNLGAAGGFEILPKHVFATHDFNKLNFDFPVVSGPYRLGRIKEGIFLTLERRADWWQQGFLRTANTLNFASITYRFFAERENAFEAFKKRTIDIPIYTSRIWVNETRGEKFNKNWIVKQRIKNKTPVGFQGFAMNMRRAPFSDVRVRHAMAHLLDREKMNRTLMYGQYFLHRSYYEDLYSEDYPCKNPVFDFNKERARHLLHEAGWTANPETGLLEKDRVPFTFRFLERSASSEKFLSIYQQDLKDVGIVMHIEKKDWAAWARDMESFHFDMTWASWSAGIFKDPEGMWHSKEAEREGGNNITGFKNDRVDAMVEKQKTIFDVTQRHAICRDIDAIVAAECPYILLWNIDSTRLLYWNTFGTPPTVLSKFGDERSAAAYWWFDEDSAADLNYGMQEGTFLPPHPPVVDFENTFSGNMTIQTREAVR